MTRKTSWIIAALCAALWTGVACAAENTGAVAAGQPLSHDQALQIALNQTGGGTVVESELDRKRFGQIVYEFEIINNGMKYEVEVDGHSGAIVEFKQKGARGWAPTTLPAPGPVVSPASPPPAVSALPGSPRLDAAAVQAMARERAGGGQVTKYEIDWDDGRLVHEVTVVTAGMRHKMEIDDATGQVVEYSLKR